MLNKELSAETKAQQRTTADFSTSASVEANPMLSAAIGIRFTEEMFKEAEAMQEECHFFIKALMKQKSISYDAAQMVWLFKKLSQMEIRLRSLERFRR